MESLARWCYRRRRAVLGVWLMALVGLGAPAFVLGGTLGDSFELPGTESQRTIDLLQERFPAVAGDTASIVFAADGGVDDPSVRADMEALFDQVSKLDHIRSVTSPYTPIGAASISPDRTIAFASLQFDASGIAIPKPLVAKLQRLREEANRPGLQVELGGSAIQLVEQSKISGHEEIGLVVAAFVLVITFGSAVAAGLPLMLALFGLGIGMALVTLATRVVDVSSISPQLASMIGLGVGIDYALFIVTRYRQALSAHATPEDAVAISMNTAGRSVLFAGCTVAISLLGLLVVNMPFVYSMALVTVSVVVIVVLASLTLLPALLGFAGQSINRLTLVRRRNERDTRTTVWFRWSRFVQRHPWTALLVGIAATATLMLPAFSVRLGTVDAGNDPTTRSTRRSYDLLSKAFGPGFNGPLLIVAELKGQDDTRALDALAAELQKSGRGIPSPSFANEAGDTAVMQVIPQTSPQDERTERLIHDLRAELIPEATRGTSAKIFVGGVTALYVDMGNAFTAKLPLFIGGVIGMSFLLLMAVFRSVLIPLKAAIMNLASIGAACGVIVAVFQWGWFNDIVGLDRTGPIESFLPMFLFAVLFGLSMDYEVFLLGAVREEYLRTGRNDLAVADGLAATARIITAAAIIMITVFSSFVLTDSRLLKLAGIGMSSAILIDATLLRLVIAPAALELMGNANWWFPGWLDRIVPHIYVDKSGVDRRRFPRDEGELTAPWYAMDPAGWTIAGSEDGQGIDEVAVQGSRTLNG